MTRKLTRIQTLFAGGAFAVAGVFGSSTAALAADHDPVVTSEHTAVAQAVTQAQAAPSREQLHPMPITGKQQQFTPDAEQIANAKAIVDAGKALNLPPRAWTIAVATSLQESNLHNIGHLGERNDHDSQGLFQQRPSSGWGTPEQITDPTYAATAFYQGTDSNRGLVEVDGWQDLPLTKVAQKVQVSAYPDHYAKHETEAGDIIAAVHGEGPYADIAK
jgi:hypothetical protein